MNKNDIRKLLTEYNTKTADIFNDIITSSDLPLNIELNRIESVEKIVSGKMFDWMKQYKSAFKDNNLYDYLVNSIDSETAYHLIIYSSYICDDGVPASFIQLLDRYKASIQKNVMNYLIEVDWENHEKDDSYADDTIISVAALLNLLSEWTLVIELDQLINKYSGLSQPYDIISDAMKKMIVETANADNSTIIKAISDILFEHKDLTIPGEHLLISLVEKNKGKNIDAVYSCLQQCFEFMRNKQIGLICFADLDDRRAVSYIRTWLLGIAEDNVEAVIIKEAISSLKRMGDKAEDMETQFAKI